LSAIVQDDPKTKLSRGFGFVVFEQPEDADAAVKALNGMVLGKQPISVEPVRGSYHHMPRLAAPTPLSPRPNR
jgi:RNA recognition motif-containing protein